MGKPCRFIYIKNASGRSDDAKEIRMKLHINFGPTSITTPTGSNVEGATHALMGRDNRKNKWTIILWPEEKRDIKAITSSLRDSHNNVWVQGVFSQAKFRKKLVASEHEKEHGIVNIDHVEMIFDNKPICETEYNEDINKKIKQWMMDF